MAGVGNRTYKVAVTPKAIALAQLLNTPRGKLMSPLADGRLERHHLLHIPKYNCAVAIRPSNSCRLIELMLQSP